MATKDELELGLAVRVDGMDAPVTIANLRGETVTVHDLNQAAMEVAPEEITVV